MKGVVNCAEDDRVLSATKQTMRKVQMDTELLICCVHGVKADDSNGVMPDVSAVD